MFFLSRAKEDRNWERGGVALEVSIESPLALASIALATASNSRLYFPLPPLSSSSSEIPQTRPRPRSATPRSGPLSWTRSRASPTCSRGRPVSLLILLGHALQSMEERASQSTASRDSVCASFPDSISPFLLRAGDYDDAWSLSRK